MRISDAFFDCDSEIDRAFADGLTAEEVYKRVIEHYNQKIRELENGGHYREAAALEHNKLIFIVTVFVHLQLIQSGEIKKQNSSNRTKLYSCSSRHFAKSASISSDHFRSISPGVYTPSRSR